MRYEVSGVNDVAIDDSSTLNLVDLMGRGITTGRVCYLRGAWFYNASTAMRLALWDGTEGSIATASTATLMGEIPCASVSLTMVEYPAPGLKFSTGVGVVFAATAPTATNQGIVGRAGGCGYEQ